MTDSRQVPRLLVVTGNYPSIGNPSNGTFVQAFVHALVDSGAEAEVIHPISVFARRHGPYPNDERQLTAGGGNVEVRRRLFLSFSIVGKGLMGTARLTQAAFEASVLREARSARKPPAISYGHFLYQAGRAAVRVGKVLGIPSFVAVGEGTFWTVEPIGFERARRDFSGATGFIAVSNPIRKGLEQRLGIPTEKIGVFPNGVDRGRFHQMDRQLSRRRLGLPPDRPLVAFVGAFDELKGGQVLLEAARGLPDVGLLLIGRGPVKLESDQVVFRGVVPHADVPAYLSAADVFVLPTLEEGSCNALAEAMACGLPIVTSRADYVEDLVDDRTGLLVDPRDPRSVREALAAILTSPERRKVLAERSLMRAETLDINQRAGKVLAWMAERSASMKRGRGVAGTPSR